MNTTETASPFFELRGVKTSFSSRPVLNGIDITIPKGKTTVILGGSGAGKSVLLKHLNGLLTPDEGEVLIEGSPTMGFQEIDWAPLRRRIGILFQNGALFDSMTVAENVAFPLLELGTFSAEDIGARVEEALGLVGLADQGDTAPDVLSGGMRKRAALARALVTRPDAMLYDEPTAGLDPVLAKSVGDLILSFQHKFSLTSVVVTHHLGLMRLLADQVVFVESGRVLFTGTIEEFETAKAKPILQFREADEM